MNTGITDARGLGCGELALVAVGRAPRQLLDTYGRERRVAPWGPRCWA